MSTFAWLVQGIGSVLYSTCITSLQKGNLYFVEYKIIRTLFFVKYNIPYQDKRYVGLLVWKIIRNYLIWLMRTTFCKEQRITEVN